MGAIKQITIAPKQQTKVDWLVVRKWYLEHGDADYPEVAKEFGISLNTVKSRGAQEGWLELRRRATAKAETKIFNSVVDNLSKLNNEHAERFRLVQAYTQRRLVLAMAKMQQAENQAQETIYVEALGTSVPLIDDRKLISPQQINFLTSALKESIFGERIAKGLPTSVSKSENDINVSNPYANYTVEQLEKVYEAIDAKLRSKYERKPEVLEAVTTGP